MGNPACAGGLHPVWYSRSECADQPLCDPDPYALGIIATRSVDKPVIGLKDLMVQHEERIRNGMKAYALLEQLRAGSTDQAVRDQFNNVKKDLGWPAVEALYPERR